MRKGLEDVVKAISIDLDLNVWCDECPYKFRINCKEDLRDDLLFHVKELREENDRLRYSKGMFEEAIKSLPIKNNIKEDIKKICEQNEQLMK